MEQARNMDIKSTFIGSDGWDDPLMSTTLADNEPVDGYYCTNLDPDAVDFNAAYEAKYGAVDGIAATGYDAMRILKMAIETVGSTDDPILLRFEMRSLTSQITKARRLSLVSMRTVILSKVSVCDKFLMERRSLI